MDFNKIVQKEYAPTRSDVDVVNPDPKQGLNQEQVDIRTACGWDNATPTSAGRTEREIILGNTFTFFNLNLAPWPSSGALGLQRGEDAQSQVSDTHCSQVALFSQSTVSDSGQGTEVQHVSPSCPVDGTSMHTARPG